MKDFDFLLDYRATATEAEVFWDMPLYANKETVYEVLVDGLATSEVSKTHISFDNLVPDTDYVVEIRVKDSGKSLVAQPP